MPVFLTENIATELGLSNGSEGTVVSLKYEEKDNRRYLISVTVDFPSYTGGEGSCPHHVTLKPLSSTFTFTIPGSDRAYGATRHQVPLIPGFAYTAHNSQGRSLNTACIDFASCTSIACAYVMLSRLKSLEGLSILRPFSFDKINKHAPEDVRNELKRMDDMYEVTKANMIPHLSLYYSIFPDQLP